MARRAVFVSEHLPPNSLVIGEQVYCQALYADGQPFVFSRPQMEFLLHLEETKVLETACVRSDRTIEWARAFLASRKFRAFRNAKMLEVSVKNGITVEWWYQFGKEAAAGRRDWYEASCAICHEQAHFNTYEIEAARQDDMSLKAQCPVCFQPVVPEKKSEKFEPTREQLVAWQEIGARLTPKIERVQHEFAPEEFVFRAQEAV